MAASTHHPRSTFVAFDTTFDDDEANNNNNSGPPQPPPKDAIAQQHHHHHLAGQGPLRSSSSHSSLKAHHQVGSKHLRPTSAYHSPPTSASASGGAGYLDAQIHQPRAYRSTSNSARSSTLGAPVTPIRSTSPFAGSQAPNEAELADALRDSVIFGSDNGQPYSHSQRRAQSQLIDLNETDDIVPSLSNVSSYRQYGNKVRPNTTFLDDMPSTHAYSQSTSGLPSAPSANMAAERERREGKPRASLQNPFEADEIDPAELEKQAPRVKFGRSHTR